MAETYVLHTLRTFADMDLPLLVSPAAVQAQVCRRRLSALHGEGAAQCMAVHCPGVTLYVAP